MKRAVFRFLCLLLLLAGQQAALTHALSHAQDRIARSAAGVRDASSAQGPAKPGERYALCDFDYAFSQMLGAVHSACLPPSRVEAAFDTVALRAAVHDASSAPPFLIRGPPPAL